MDAIAAVCGRRRLTARPPGPCQHRPDRREPPALEHHRTHGDSPDGESDAAGTGSGTRGEHPGHGPNQERAEGLGGDDLGAPGCDEQGRADSSGAELARDGTLLGLAAELLHGQAEGVQQHG